MYKQNQHVFFALTYTQMISKIPQHLFLGSSRLHFSCLLCSLLVCRLQTPPLNMHWAAITQRFHEPTHLLSAIFNIIDELDHNASSVLLVSYTLLYASPLISWRISLSCISLSATKNSKYGCNITAHAIKKKYQPHRNLPYVHKNSSHQAWKELVLS